MHIYPAIHQNPLLHLCITEPLRLGSGEIIAESEGGVLVYDRIARLHLLSAESEAAARALLSRVEKADFILCCNGEFAHLLNRFGLENRMFCRQYAYLRRETPAADPRLFISPPDDAAFARILEAYRMSTPEELALQRERGQIFFARNAAGQDVGFVGLHPEGCFGMLQVFESQRRMGYGAALENHIIRWCMENGRVPYCQVSLENEASMSLQKKLGLCQTTETLVMAWNSQFQA